MIMPIGQHFLYGVPDVLIETSRGWEIWDWKTNRHDTRTAREWLDYYRLQLEVYALLAASAFPEQEHITVRLIMTRPPVEMVHRTYSRAELHTVASRIEMLAQRIVRTAIESEEAVGGESLTL
jgi:predicted RecB family nuclease